MPGKQGGCCYGHNYILITGFDPGSIQPAMGRFSKATLVGKSEAVIVRVTVNDVNSVIYVSMSLHGAWLRGFLSIEESHEKQSLGGCMKTAFVLTSADAMAGDAAGRFTLLCAHPGR
jgi:hypothetical protein